MQNYTSRLGVAGATNETIAHQLYLYENDAPVTSIQERRYSRLVVGGSYKGGPTTYYPVDFLDDEDPETILQVTRNYKYQVIISTVSSEGYTDPGTASEAFDSRMKLVVIDWNMQNENELAFDGPHFVSLEDKQVYLYRSAGSTRELSMTTNVPKEELVMDFTEVNEQTDNGPVYRSGDGFSIWNNRFKAEIVFDTNGEIKALRFTALGDYDTVNPNRNLQNLQISSCRMKLVVEIEQVNEHPSDWIDGGNIPGYLGEEEE